MDEIMDKTQASEFLGMTPRNINKLMETRLVPYIRVFVSVSRSGQVFFSKKKLEEYKRHSSIEDLEGMTEAQKEAWVFEQKMNILVEQKKETTEKALVVKAAYRLKQFKDMFDFKTSEFGKEERKKLEACSDIFIGHLELIGKLREYQKKRLLEFFEDEECVFQRFPDLFKSELKAKEPTTEEKELQKRIEAGEVVVSMRGGIKVEHYPTLPGTLKPKEENIQVVQEGSELTRLPEKIEEEE